MKRQSILVLAMVVVFATTTPSWADLVGYVGTDYGAIYFTNFETGEQTKIRQSPQGRVKALDISPIDGLLYSSGGGTLYKHNLTTEDYDKIGIGTINEPLSLAFAPDGTLYGIQSEYKLIRIDIETADTTFIASLNPYIETQAFAINQNGQAIGWSKNPDHLFEIDLSTGLTTLLGPLGLRGFDAFDYGQDGELYGWRDMYDLYHIDASTLIATHLRAFQFGGEGFTIVPEPATLLLLGLGAVMVRRKRRA